MQASSAPCRGNEIHAFWLVALGLTTLVGRGQIRVPSFDEHCDGRYEEDNSETGIEESIDNNNKLWRGEHIPVICSKVRIAHHLGLMYQDVHRVWFEATEEFDDERAQETGK